MEIVVQSPQQDEFAQAEIKKKKEKEEKERKKEKEEKDQAEEKSNGQGHEHEHEHEQKQKAQPPIFKPTERKLASWISTYLKYTKDQESPSIFHIWSAILTLAGAVRNEVWLDRGTYTLYPNVYAVFVAESARCRKTTALELAPTSFLANIPYANVVAGTTTAAGLIDALRLPYDHNGFSIDPKGCAFILGGELTWTFHEGSERSRIIRMLTAYYSGSGNTEDVTRGLGRQKIDKVCLNFGAATTPKSLPEIVSNDTVGVGLLGRVIWIHAEQPRKAMPWPTTTDEMIKLKELLMYDLRIISQLKGSFKVTPEARDYYALWYTSELMKQLDEASAPIDREYLGRKGDHVLKLAMLLSLDLSNDLILTKAHIEKALKNLAFIEQSMWKAFRFVGTDANALASDILSMIASKPTKAATLPQLVSAFKSRVQKRSDLEAALDLLKEEGLIEKKMLPLEKKIVWLLTADGIKMVLEGSTEYVETRGKPENDKDEDEEKEYEGTDPIGTS